MIVLDTNILSELIRPTPAAEVKHWLLHNDQVLATTAITIFEIEYGLSQLPDGRRRKVLVERFAALNSTHLEFAILPLDEKAARLAGRIRGKHEALGLGTQSADMMIAAVTLLAGASLATRNAKDFTNTGIEVINPWNIAN